MLITAFGDTYIIHEDDNVFERKLITGRKSTDSKCIGYCTYTAHRGYLDDDLIREHNCLTNRCNYFMTKLPETEDAGISELGRQLKTLQKQLDSERDALHIMCNSVTDCFEGMKITKVIRRNNKWLIKYVKICSVDEREICESLKMVVPGEFTLEQEICDFEAACRIVCGDE